MADVKYAHATRIYTGNSVPSVDHLDLHIGDGEFMVLVGPSGSGKSTALRMLAGLEPVDDGEILIGGRDVSSTPPKDRDIAMVFQNYALYPHMTVADNMGFALKIQGVAKEERTRRVLDAARLLDLEKYLDRRPKALSGGQRQRVAMGRAIVRDPSVFLMDEPLSNLDAKLRVETRANIAGLQNRLGATMVYVTHDQIEAMTMGDRVAVLKDGVLQQVDSPRDIYLRPRNAFVAGFIGSPAMNLRPGKVLADRVLLDNASFAVDRRVVSESESSDVLVGIRPESLVPTHCDGALRLEVILVEQLGADAFVHGTLDGDSLGDKAFVVRCDSRTPPRIGETLHVTTTPDELHIFDTVTGRRLSQAGTQVA
ncbi:ABC transporter ATP-binding protein [Rhodococcus sp. NCIMB 12038]|uniref:ABC transporter ATP-binding protein n=1 Tax=Rhodococcus sp. NCIMB 12038 TaxID=933800 RepID=UPI000B3BFFE4|nr:sn-glycerol-3-phosphate ABC transporter ATP-binding protein UgpC [Rhodococcus sp. NCIMB 12038]OUS82919.1 sugar ABC transporter ATP-binding protein [Rhodococcus sp. NCIMB 12038]